ncbi:MAG: carboxypeptidase regulatory-like domain-containing protein, partial [Bdellovibrionales bacterium]|nr:carboxypeptidase regulatory-like domain-containing protein [Bdellovibrionales bacterium]
MSVRIRQWIAISIHLRSATLAVLFLLLAGCAGGGSRGTGGFEYRGTLLSRTGAPLVNIEVTIAQTGDSDLTDENGLYEILSDPPTGPVQILLRSEGFSSEVTIPPPTAAAVGLRVDIALDETTGTAEPIAVDEVISITDSESPSEGPPSENQPTEDSTSLPSSPGSQSGSPNTGMSPEGSPDSPQLPNDTPADSSDGNGADGGAIGDNTAGDGNAGSNGNAGGNDNAGGNGNAGGN